MVCSWMSWPSVRVVWERAWRRKPVTTIPVESSLFSWCKLLRWKCNNESMWSLCTAKTTDVYTENQVMQDLSFILTKTQKTNDNITQYLLNDIDSQKNGPILDTPFGKNESWKCLHKQMVSFDSTHVSTENIVPIKCDHKQRTKSYPEEYAQFAVEFASLGDVRLSYVTDETNNTSVGTNTSTTTFHANRNGHSYAKFHLEQRSLSPIYIKVDSSKNKNMHANQTCGMEAQSRRIKRTCSIVQQPKLRMDQKSFFFTSEIQTFGETYAMNNIIGRGAFGFVRSGHCIRDGRKVVIKVIHADRLPANNFLLVPRDEMVSNSQDSNVSLDLARRYRDFRDKYDKMGFTQNLSTLDESFYLIPREIWFLRQLHHPQIIQMLDWADDEQQHFFLVMPAHGLGMDLFEFIDRQPLIDECLGSYMFRQLASAVSYLHSVQLAHRDIKDENILVDEQFQLKLIDFGSAIATTHESKMFDFCGTTEYCGPEVFIGEGYDPFEADIWAMGVTLYTLMVGENPFTSQEEILRCPLRLPDWMSDDLRQVLLATIQPIPQKRLKANEVQQLPWVMHPVAIEHYSFSAVLKDTSFRGNLSADYRGNTPDFTRLND